MKDLTYLKAILDARFNDPEMVFRFHLEYIRGQGMFWRARAVIGKPHTCATVIYDGTGDTIEKACRQVIEKVITNDGETPEGPTQPRICSPECGQEHGQTKKGRGE